MGQRDKKAPKLVVVTGAAGGLGVALARALQSAGHRVVGLDLRGADGRLDVTEPDACRELARRVAPDGEARPL